MAWAAAPTGKRGRPLVYTDAAVQTCLTMKGLFGMALRQTTGFVESLLCLIGLNWDVPDFSTLSRPLPGSRMAHSPRGARRPLRWTSRIERRRVRCICWSTAQGSRSRGEGEWNARKHGGAKRWVWRKVHLGIDEQTLEIRAVEVTSSDVGDAPMLPKLLSQDPSRSGDRQRHCPLSRFAGKPLPGNGRGLRHAQVPRRHPLPDSGLNANHERGRTGCWCRDPVPQDAQLFQKTTVAAGAAARNEALRASKYLSRALWRPWSGYHRRSRAETKMHCVKLLGQRLPYMVCRQTITGQRMARDFDRQIAEFQIRVAVLNGYTALGIPVTKVAR
jgi:hypothetical protein